MTALKLTGGALILVACMVWAADRRAKMKEQLRVLEAIVRFIRYVRREIDCFATPFPDILAGFSDETLDKYDFTADPASAARCLPIEPAQRDELTKFIDSIGGSFAEGELKLCDMYIEIFTSAADAAREEYPRRAKVQSSLAFLVGAGTLILIL